ncbi:hypothetical protein [Streptomyces fragilis]|nr:hypothetical protein [Streptomyces fragilis]
MGIRDRAWPARRPSSLSSSCIARASWTTSWGCLLYTSRCV